MSPRLASRITGIAGCAGANVGDQALQRVFGAGRCEVRDLRLERTDEIRGRVDDRFAELEDRIVAAQ